LCIAHAFVDGQALQGEQRDLFDSFDGIGPDVLAPLYNASEISRARKALQGMVENPSEAFAPSKWPLYLWRLGFGPLIGQFFILITTIGRKSGLPRRAIVAYFFVNGKKYVVAHPDAQWVQNVAHTPAATLQTAYGTESVTVRAVTDDGERAMVLAHLRHNRPRVAALIDSPLTAQQNALFTFEPTHDTTPPALPDDWRRYTWAALLSLAAWFVSRRKRKQGRR
jgi:deazaflavin-dependent oxidoreductase (nitroreductase family)